MVFVRSFQLRQLRIVSDQGRYMGYLRVGCLAGVSPQLVTLAYPYPVGDQ